MKFEVRSLSNLIEKVIPHFEKFPLKSAKQRDFLLFAKICRKIQKLEHLGAKGLKEIIKLAYEMNGSGKRKYSEKELLSLIR